MIAPMRSRSREEIIKIAERERASATVPALPEARQQPLDRFVRHPRRLARAPFLAGAMRASLGPCRGVPDEALQERTACQRPDGEDT